MRLELASRKAVKYAVEKWHYSHNAAPRAYDLPFTVFDNEEFCGVVCYGRGATNDIGAPYGLKSGQAIELIRVALNGKQNFTSQAVGISLKILRKYAPQTKLVVSFADPEQGHIGTIYQATNWIYMGRTTPADEYILNGTRMHGRTYRSKGRPAAAKKVKGSSKLRYVYAWDKQLKKQLQERSLPYPARKA